MQANTSNFVMEIVTNLEANHSNNEGRSTPPNEKDMYDNILYQVARETKKETKSSGELKYTNSFCCPHPMMHFHHRLPPSRGLSSTHSYSFELHDRFFFALIRMLLGATARRTHLSGDDVNDVPIRYQHRHRLSRQHLLQMFGFKATKHTLLFLVFSLISIVFFLHFACLKNQQRIRYCDEEEEGEEDRLVGREYTTVSLAALYGSSSIIRKNPSLEPGYRSSIRSPYQSDGEGPFTFLSDYWSSAAGDAAEGTPAVSNGVRGFYAANFGFVLYARGESLFSEEKARVAGLPDVVEPVPPLSENYDGSLERMKEKEKNDSLSGNSGGDDLGEDDAKMRGLGATVYNGRAAKTRRRKGLQSRRGIAGSPFRTSDNLKSRVPSPEELFVFQRHIDQLKAEPTPPLHPSVLQHLTKFQKRRRERVDQKEAQLSPTAEAKRSFLINEESDRARPSMSSRSPPQRRSARDWESISEALAAFPSFIPLIEEDAEVDDTNLDNRVEKADHQDAKLQSAVGMDRLLIGDRTVMRRHLEDENEQESVKSEANGKAPLPTTNSELAKLIVSALRAVEYEEQQSLQKIKTGATTRKGEVRGIGNRKEQAVGEREEEEEEEEEEEKGLSPLYDWAESLIPHHVINRVHSLQSEYDSLLGHISRRSTLRTRSDSRETVKTPPSSGGELTEKREDPMNTIASQQNSNLLELQQKPEEPFGEVVEFLHAAKRKSHFSEQSFLGTGDTVAGKEDAFLDPFSSLSLEARSLLAIHALQRFVSTSKVINALREKEEGVNNTPDSNATHSAAATPTATTTNAHNNVTWPFAFNYSTTAAEEQRILKSRGRPVGGMSPMDETANPRRLKIKTYVVPSHPWYTCAGQGQLVQYHLNPNNRYLCQSYDVADAITIRKITDEYARLAEQWLSRNLLVKETEPYEPLRLDRGLGRCEDYIPFVPKEHFSSSETHAGPHEFAFAGKYTGGNGAGDIFALNTVKPQTSGYGGQTSNNNGGLRGRDDDSSTNQPDLILYVTYRFDLVSANVCQFHSKSGRPTVINLNIGPRLVNSDFGLPSGLFYDRYETVLKHYYIAGVLINALVLNRNFAAMTEPTIFLKNSLNISDVLDNADRLDKDDEGLLPAEAYIQQKDFYRSKARPEGRSVELFSAPELREWAAYHYRCFEFALDGYEDDAPSTTAVGGGGGGSTLPSARSQLGIEAVISGADQFAFFHDRLISDTVLSNTFTDISLGNETLALLRATGWFDVDWANVRSLRHTYFGAGAGCEFVTKKCDQQRHLVGPAGAQEYLKPNLTVPNSQYEIHFPTTDPYYTVISQKKIPENVVAPSELATPRGRAVAVLAGTKYSNVSILQNSFCFLSLTSRCHVGRRMLANCQIRDNLFLDPEMRYFPENPTRGGTSIDTYHCPVNYDWARYCSAILGTYLLDDSDFCFDSLESVKYDVTFGGDSLYGPISPPNRARVPPNISVVNISTYRQTGWPRCFRVVDCDPFTFSYRTVAYNQTTAEWDDAGWCSDVSHHRGTFDNPKVFIYGEIPYGCTAYETVCSLNYQESTHLRPPSQIPDDPTIAISVLEDVVPEDFDELRLIFDPFPVPPSEFTYADFMAIREGGADGATMIRKKRAYLKKKYWRNLTLGGIANGLNSESGATEDSKQNFYQWLKLGHHSIGVRHVRGESDICAKFSADSFFSDFAGVPTCSSASNNGASSSASACGANTSSSSTASSVCARSAVAADYTGMTLEVTLTNLSYRVSFRLPRAAAIRYGALLTLQMPMNSKLHCAEYLPKLEDWRMPSFSNSTFSMASLFFNRTSGNNNSNYTNNNNINTSYWDYLNQHFAVSLRNRTRTRDQNPPSPSSRFNCSEEGSEKGTHTGNKYRLKANHDEVRSRSAQRRQSEMIGIVIPRREDPHIQSSTMDTDEAAAASTTTISLSFRCDYRARVSPLSDLQAFSGDPGTFPQISLYSLFTANNNFNKSQGNYNDLLPAKVLQVIRNSFAATENISSAGPLNAAKGLFAPSLDQMADLLLNAKSTSTAGEGGEGGGEAYANALLEPPLLKDLPAYYDTILPPMPKTEKSIRPHFFFVDKVATRYNVNFRDDDLGPFIQMAMYSPSFHRNCANGTIEVASCTSQERNALNNHTNCQSEADEGTHLLLHPWQIPDPFVTDPQLPPFSPESNGADSVILSSANVSSNFTKFVNEHSITTIGERMASFFRAVASAKAAEEAEAARIVKSYNPRTTTAAQRLSLLSQAEQLRTFSTEMFKVDLTAVEDPSTGAANASLRFSLLLSPKAASPRPPSNNRPEPSLYYYVPANAGAISFYVDFPFLLKKNASHVINISAATSITSADASNLGPAMINADKRFSGAYVPYFNDAVGRGNGKINDLATTIPKRSLIDEFGKSFPDSLFGKSPNIAKDNNAQFQDLLPPSYLVDDNAVGYDCVDFSSSSAVPPPPPYFGDVSGDFNNCSSNNKSCPHGGSRRGAVTPVVTGLRVEAYHFDNVLGSGRPFVWRSISSAPSMIVNSYGSGINAFGPMLYWKIRGPTACYGGVEFTLKGFSYKKVAPNAPSPTPTPTPTTAATSQQQQPQYPFPVDNAYIPVSVPLGYVGAVWGPPSTSASATGCFVTFTDNTGFRNCSARNSTKNCTTTCKEEEYQKVNFDDNSTANDNAMRGAILFESGAPTARFARLFAANVTQNAHEALLPNNPVSYLEPNYFNAAPLVGSNNEFGEYSGSASTNRDLNGEGGVPPLGQPFFVKGGGFIHGSRPIDDKGTSPSTAKPRSVNLDEGQWTIDKFTAFQVPNLTSPIRLFPTISLKDLTPARNKFFMTLQSTGANAGTDIYMDLTIPTVEGGRFGSNGDGISRRGGSGSYLSGNDADTIRFGRMPARSRMPWWFTTNSSSIILNAAPSGVGSSTSKTTCTSRASELYSFVSLLSNEARSKIQSGRTRLTATIGQHEGPRGTCSLETIPAKDARSCLLNVSNYGLLISNASLAANAVSNYYAAATPFINSTIFSGTGSVGVYGGIRAGDVFVFDWVTDFVLRWDQMLLKEGSRRVPVKVLGCGDKFVVDAVAVWGHQTIRITIRKITLKRKMVQKGQQSQPHGTAVVPPTHLYAEPLSGILVKAMTADSYSEDDSDALNASASLLVASCGGSNSYSTPSSCSGRTRNHESYSRTRLESLVCRPPNGRIGLYLKGFRYGTTRIGMAFRYVSRQWVRREDTELVTFGAAVARASVDSCDCDCRSSANKTSIQLPPNSSSFLVTASAMKQYGSSPTIRTVLTPVTVGTFSFAPADSNLYAMISIGTLDTVACNGRGRLLPPENSGTNGAGPSCRCFAGYGGSNCDICAYISMNSSEFHNATRRMGGGGVGGGASNSNGVNHEEEEDLASRSYGFCKRACDTSVPWASECDDWLGILNPVDNCLCYCNGTVCLRPTQTASFSMELTTSKNTVSRSISTTLTSSTTFTQTQTVSSSVTLTKPITKTAEPSFTYITNTQSVPLTPTYWPTNTELMSSSLSPTNPSPTLSGEGPSLTQSLLLSRSSTFSGNGSTKTGSLSTTVTTSITVSASLTDTKSLGFTNTISDDCFVIHVSNPRPRGYIERKMQGTAIGDGASEWRYYAHERESYSPLPKEVNNYDEFKFSVFWRDFILKAVRPVTRRPQDFEYGDWSLPFNNRTSAVSNSSEGNTIPQYLLNVFEAALENPETKPHPVCVFTVCLSWNPHCPPQYSAFVGPQAFDSMQIPAHVSSSVRESAVIYVKFCNFTSSSEGNLVGELLANFSRFVREKNGSKELVAAKYAGLATPTSEVVPMFPVVKRQSSGGATVRYCQPPPQPPAARNSLSMTITQTRPFLRRYENLIVTLRLTLCDSVRDFDGNNDDEFYFTILGSRPPFRPTNIPLLVGELYRGLSFELLLPVDSGAKFYGCISVDEVVAKFGPQGVTTYDRYSNHATRNRTDLAAKLAETKEALNNLFRAARSPAQVASVVCVNRRVLSTLPHPDQPATVVTALQTVFVLRVRLEPLTISPSLVSGRRFGFLQLFPFERCATPEVNKAFGDDDEDETKPTRDARDEENGSNDCPSDRFWKKIIESAPIQNGFQRVRVSTSAASTFGMTTDPVANTLDPSAGLRGVQKRTSGEAFVHGGTIGFAILIAESYTCTSGRVTQATAVTTSNINKLTEAERVRAVLYSTIKNYFEEEHLAAHPLAQPVWSIRLPILPPTLSEVIALDAANRLLMGNTNYKLSTIGEPVLLLSRGAATSAAATAAVTTNGAAFSIAPDSGSENSSGLLRSIEIISMFHTVASALSFAIAVLFTPWVTLLDLQLLSLVARFSSRSNFHHNSYKNSAALSLSSSSSSSSSDGGLYSEESAVKSSFCKSAPVDSRSVETLQEFTHYYQRVDELRQKYLSSERARFTATAEEGTRSSASVNSDDIGSIEELCERVLCELGPPPRLDKHGGTYSVTQCSSGAEAKRERDKEEERKVILDLLRGGSGGGTGGWPLFMTDTIGYTISQSFFRQILPAHLTAFIADPHMALFPSNFRDEHTFSSTILDSVRSGSVLLRDSFLNMGASSSSSSSFSAVTFGEDLFRFSVSSESFFGVDGAPEWLSKKIKSSTPSRWVHLNTSINLSPIRGPYDDNFVAFRQVNPADMVTTTGWDGLSGFNTSKEAEGLSRASSREMDELFRSSSEEFYHLDRWIGSLASLAFLLVLALFIVAATVIVRPLLPRKKRKTTKQSVGNISIGSSLFVLNVTIRAFDLIQKRFVSSVVVCAIIVFTSSVPYYAANTIVYHAQQDAWNSHGGFSNFGDSFSSSSTRTTTTTIVVLSLVTCISTLVFLIMIPCCLWVRVKQKMRSIPYRRFRYIRRAVGARSKFCWRNLGGRGAVAEEEYCEEEAELFESFLQDEQRLLLSSGKKSKSAAKISTAGAGAGASDWRNKTKNRWATPSLDRLLQRGESNKRDFRIKTTTTRRASYREARLQRAILCELLYLGQSSRLKSEEAEENKNDTDDGKSTGDTAATAASSSYSLPVSRNRRGGFFSRGFSHIYSAVVRPPAGTTAAAWSGKSFNSLFGESSSDYDDEEMAEIPRDRAVAAIQTKEITGCRNSVRGQSPKSNHRRSEFSDLEEGLLQHDNTDNDQNPVGFTEERTRENFLRITNRQRREGRLSEAASRMGTTTAAAATAVVPSPSYALDIEPLRSQRLETFSNSVNAPRRGSKHTPSSSSSSSLSSSIALSDNTCHDEDEDGTSLRVEKDKKKKSHHRRAEERPSAQKTATDQTKDYNRTFAALALETTRQEFTGKTQLKKNERERIALEIKKRRKLEKELSRARRHQQRSQYRGNQMPPLKSTTTQNQTQQPMMILSVGGREATQNAVSAEAHALKTHERPAVEVCRRILSQLYLFVFAPFTFMLPDGFWCDEEDFTSQRYRSYLLFKREQRRVRRANQVRVDVSTKKRTDDPTIVEEETAPATSSAAKVGSEEESRSRQPCLANIKECFCKLLKYKYDAMTARSRNPEAAVANAQFLFSPYKPSAVCIQRRANLHTALHRAKGSTLVSRQHRAKREKGGAEIACDDVSAEEFTNNSDTSDEDGGGNGYDWCTMRNILPFRKSNNEKRKASRRDLTAKNSASEETGRENSSANDWRKKSREQQRSGGAVLSSAEQEADGASSGLSLSSFSSNRQGETLFRRNADVPLSVANRGPKYMSKCTKRSQSSAGSRREGGESPFVAIRRHYRGLAPTFILILRNWLVSFLLGFGGRFNVCNDGYDSGKGQVWASDVTILVLITLLLVTSATYFALRNPFVNPWSLVVNVACSILTPIILILLSVSDDTLNADPTSYFMSASRNQGGERNESGTFGSDQSPLLFEALANRKQKALGLVTASLVLIVAYDIIVCIVSVPALAAVHCFIAPMLLRRIEESIAAVNAQAREYMRTIIMMSTAKRDMQKKILRGGEKETPSASRGKKSRSGGRAFWSADMRLVSGGVGGIGFFREGEHMNLDHSDETLSSTSSLDRNHRRVHVHENQRKGKINSESDGGSPAVLRVPRLARVESASSSLLSSSSSSFLSTESSATAVPVPLNTNVPTIDEIRSRLYGFGRGATHSGGGGGGGGLGHTHTADEERMPLRRPLRRITDDEIGVIAASVASIHDANAVSKREMENRKREQSLQKSESGQNTRKTKRHSSSPPSPPARERSGGEESESEQDTFSSSSSLSLSFEEITSTLVQEDGPADAEDDFIFEDDWDR